MDYKPHEFKTDAQVIPEVKILQHVDDIVTTILVLLPDVIQNSHLNQCLMVESLLVSDYLDGDMLVGHMIQGPYHLSKAAFSDHLQDLVAISYMVVQDLDKLPQFSMLISVLLSGWWSR